MFACSSVHVAVRFSSLQENGRISTGFMKKIYGKLTLRRGKIEKARLLHVFLMSSQWCALQTPYYLEEFPRRNCWSDTPRRWIIRGEGTIRWEWRGIIILMNIFGTTPKPMPWLSRNFWETCQYRPKNPRNWVVFVRYFNISTCICVSLPRWL